MTRSDATSPSQAASEEVDLEAGKIRGRGRAITRAILMRLFRLTIGFRVEGLEHVPAEGPVIVVGNHLHNADPILVEVAFPRSLHYMAKKELFSVPVVSWIVRWAGCFPVDRGKADRSAIRNAQARLKQGIAVGMFPEGTRSISRSLKTALPGAAMMSQMTGSPILPVAITGSERLPFNGAKGRRDGRPWPKRDHRGVRIRFGRPFTLPREVDGRRVSFNEATELMMAEIVALLPPDYHGVYAHLAAGRAEVDETTRPGKTESQKADTDPA